MPEDRKSIFDLDGAGYRRGAAIPISPPDEGEEMGGMGGQDPVALFRMVMEHLQVIAQMVPQLAPIIAEFLQKIAAAAGGGMGAPAPGGPPSMGGMPPGMGGMGMGRPQGAPGGMGGMPPMMRMGR